MSNINLILLGIAGLYLYEKSKTATVTHTSANPVANTPTSTNPVTQGTQPPVIPINGGGGYVDNSGGGFLESIWNGIGNAFDAIIQPSQPTYGQQYPVPPSVINAGGGSNEIDYLPNFDWNNQYVTYPDNFYYPSWDLVDSPITYMPAGANDIGNYYQQGSNSA